MKRRDTTCSLLFVFGLLAVFFNTQSRASTDLFSTGPGQGGPDSMCDVWQAIFNGWGLSAGGDEDRDGCSNWVESVAGTDPRKPGDCHKVGNTTISANTVIFDFEAEAGKKYRVLSKSTPSGAFTNPEDLKTINGAPQSPGVKEFIPESGASITAAATISVAKAGTIMFYKLEVSDVDSDNDGVSDWAENSTGLDPTNKDSDGDGIEDGAAIAAEVAAPDVVTISSAESLASEDGPQNGMFTVSRSRSLIPATVTFELSGTASAPNDFSASPATSVSFGSGEKSKAIHINPISDTDVEGSESVTATLMETSAGNYTAPVIDTEKDKATVIIYNSTAAAGTGLTARYYDHSSSTAAHGANFGDFANYTYVRTGTGSPNTGTITIPYTKTPALAVGNIVRVSFNGGNLNNALYNHMDYTVSAVTATNFTLAITGASLPTSSNSNCYFSIQSFPHPAVIERVDATVDGDWGYGTPNDVGIAAKAGTTATKVPDNYSDTFEMYLHPTTAGNYRFQLDADDKARVLLDLNNNGTFEMPGEQILEHRWDTAGTTTPEDGVADDETLGIFKISASYPLTVPANAAQRLKMRVEHVETTGDARCRLQWSRDGGAFANISQGNHFTHTQAITYAFTRGTPVTTGTATITLASHGFSLGETVKVAFSSGNLFTPNTNDPNGYSGTYTVAAVPTTSTFTIAITSTGSTLPATGTGSGFLEDRSTSTTTGVYDKVYTSTDFSGAPGRIGVSTAVTAVNNGIWGSGTPDAALINPDSFSIRWTGQVQPQFSEDYTFVINADDSARLKINGVDQPLKTLPATISGTNTTYSYNNTTGDTIVTYTNSLISTNSFTVGETVRVDPSSGNLSHANGSLYLYDSATGNAEINYSNLTNITPGGFTVGETIEVDPTSGPVNLGLIPYPVTAVTATTFTVNFGAGLFASGSGNANVSDNRNAVVTAVTPTTFTYNVGAGKYAAGTGNLNFDIVNRPLKDWAVMTSERYAKVPMIGGTRYDIQLDYFEGSGYARNRLFWFSPSQPKEIIPQHRLYPEGSPATPLAPPAHISDTTATALIGGAFTYSVLGSNNASVNVSGNPAWLTYSNGVLSGTPPSDATGDYQVLVTLTNAAGTSTSILNLHVEDTGSSIPREHWNGVAGTSVSDIPGVTPPTGTSSLNTLEAASDFGDNYGARIRGYITAPETGNYYFWIAGSNTAELWISNDDEPVNAFKRAWVTGGTASQEWNKAGETHQKSPWLALEQGRRYYIEILHKAGAGTGDNLAVGWSKPGQATDAPSEVVPGHVLSPYAAPPPGSTPGTLYVATMLSQAGAITSGVGSSTLRLSEDESYAIMTRSYANLTGPITSEHIHVDPYLTYPSMIVFDIDVPGVEQTTAGGGLQPDGSYKWIILPVGPLSKADIVEIIKQGKAYINLHTALYPNGEIRGNYTLANGSRTFTPPPAPPSWTDDAGVTSAQANKSRVRFLTQATFGPNVADLNALKAIGSYEAWIDDQFTKAPSRQLAEVLRTEQSSAQGGNFDESLTFNAWWWRSITGADQLRQRIAFALSQIHVVSAQGPLDNNAPALSYFYDKLAENAFGNFRDILVDTTLTPTMGRYLDMLRNDKPDQTVGRIPNENYAREIKQLFSVGLYRMWPDGTLMLTSKDAPIDTYSQREIVGFAHVFTGWDYGYDGAFRTSLGAATNWMRQMREVPARHFTGPKRILNNEVLPGLQAIGGQPLDPFVTHNSAAYTHPDYAALPGQELAAAHDQLFNHPNVGPFVCRQLIQRLVTSHPSRDYLYRVVSKFNDNGSGVRGDMKAVIKAILLDYEARSPDQVTKPAFGKQREPVLRIAAAGRAFRREPWSGTYTQNGTRTITISTTTPHGLTGTSGEFLNFTSGTPDIAPAVGAYNVTRVNDTTLSASSTGWVTGTYSQPANSTSVTCTMNNHWLKVGHKVYLDFTSGTANGVAGLDTSVHTLTAASPETGSGAGSNFTIADPGTPPSASRTGNFMMPRFSPGSYTTSSSGLAAPNDRRVTMDTSAGLVNSGTVDHELQVGDQVQINFYGGNPLPTDMVATVENVIDRNTWTFLAPSSGTNLGTTQGNNSVYQFPLKALPMNRSGNVDSRPSTFNMGNTNADIDQSPINSPTVFNFFLPDFKNPGTLASQGLTTPEFQTTAETTVVRQANFLYNGLFNPNLSFISSFKTGSNSLALNFAPWMPADATDVGLGTPPNNTLPWTHNQNLSALIDQFSTLLTADQLSSAAKLIIKNFVATPIASIGTHASACTITTSVPHGLNTGDTVVVSGVTDGTFGSTLGNTTTTRVVTVTGPTDGTSTTFTIPVSCTAAPTGAGLTNAHVSVVQYNQGITTPSDTNKRDRIRAIIHLILISPDFTIQR